MPAVAALLLMSLLFVNCKREIKRCWQCSVIYHGDGLPDITSDTVVCDLTQTDIDLRQNKGIRFLVRNKEPYTSWEMNNCKKR